ncbi:hypothetical protein ECAE60S_01897 [Eoetvoesiella caeni]
MFGSRSKAFAEWLSMTGKQWHKPGLRGTVNIGYRRIIQFVRRRVIFPGQAYDLAFVEGAQAWIYMPCLRRWT